MSTTNLLFTSTTRSVISKRYYGVKMLLAFRVPIAFNGKNVSAELYYEEFQTFLLKKRYLIHLPSHLNYTLTTGKAFCVIVCNTRALH